MKQRIIISGILIFVIGVLVSCSNINDNFSIASKEKNNNDFTTTVVDDNGVIHNYQIIDYGDNDISFNDNTSFESTYQSTTVIIDKSGITHYYKIIQSEKNNHPDDTNFLVEIVTDSKGKVVTDVQGNYITVVSKEDGTSKKIKIKESLENSKKISSSYSITNNSNSDNNDVKFSTTNPKEKYTTNRTNTKRTETNKNDELSKNHDENNKSTTSENIIDEEGWINKWY